MCGDVLRFDDKPVSASIAMIVKELNELSNDLIYERLDSLLEYTKPLIFRIYIAWSCSCIDGLGDTNINCGNEEMHDLCIEITDDKEFLLTIYGYNNTVMSSSSLADILKFIEKDNESCGNYQWYDTFFAFSFNEVPECVYTLDCLSDDLLFSIGNKHGEYNADPATTGYKHWKDMTNYQEYGIWYKDPNVNSIKNEFKPLFDRRDKYNDFNGFIRSLLYRLELHVPKNRFRKTKRALSV